MIKVNRLQFIGWTSGVLMDRDVSGKVFVVNEIECEKAEEALYRGETIGLMDENYDVVTTMSLVDGEYWEKLYVDNERTC